MRGLLRCGRYWKLWTAQTEPSGVTWKPQATLVQDGFVMLR
jgi:hypothetical protein